jgi:GNAT superfamily N-acetyltransferase
VDTIIRPAREDDLSATDALVVASINDLTERHGFGLIARPSPPNFQHFSLDDEPAGLWVAERNGQLAGFSFSWTCESFWFLAQLFVDPQMQAAGLGAALIGKALAHADDRNAQTRALITFAFNRASQGLYIRHGLYPVCPIYMWSIRRDAWSGGARRNHLRIEPLDQSPLTLAQLVRIDLATLGVSRAKHHGYMLSQGGLSGVSLWNEGECVGYAYAGPEGHVGPLAVADPQWLPDAFEAALDWAADFGSEQVSAFIPGSIPAALDVALHKGMRIVLPMLLMGSGRLAAWDRYLPRNPGLM